MPKTMNPALKRIFVVGCPRSGTTLLQSILLANSSILSFPESHFFVNLFKRRSELRTKLGLASRYSRPGFETFMGEAGYRGVRHTLPNYAFSLRQHTQAFIKTLDIITKKQNKSIWIEKTPDHVNFIDFIETNVDDPLFIHIVRNGPDVVASLYDVTHKYPLDWEGPWSIDRCLRKWLTCVKNTYQQKHKANHLIVNYEKLVNNTAVESQRMSDFIGVDLALNPLENRNYIFEKIALKREPWKANSVQPIYRQRTDKFHSLFDEKQRDHILEVISNEGLIDTKREPGRIEVTTEQGFHHHSLK